MKNVCKFASSMHGRIDMGFEIYPNIIASSFTNQAVNSQKRKKNPLIRLALPTVVSAHLEV